MAEAKRADNALSWGRIHKNTQGQRVGSVHTRPGGTRGVDRSTKGDKDTGNPNSGKAGPRKQDKSRGLKWDLR